jgi:hypothetical protein
MNLFKINDQFTIACEFKSTRNGFKHEAHFISNGSEVEKQKVCYLNRTWEAWTFQTVILDLINKSKFLTKEQKEEFKQKYNH